MAKVSLYLFLVAVLIESSMQSLEEDINAEINNSNGTEKRLARKRRYLVFPSGSSLQLVYCFTSPSVGMGRIFALGITAALAWELPDKPEFFRDLKNNKFPTTTEAPETTTLPQLDLDHDYDPFPHYSNPLERVDNPSKYFFGSWRPKYNRPHPGDVNNRKTYYDPFFINQPPPSVFGYSPVKTLSSQVIYDGLRGNSISGSRKKAVYEGKSRPVPAGYSSTYNQRKNKKKPVTTYINPVYHQHNRRTRRDLYGKMEKLFTALSKDGKSCLLKAICEVSQAPQRKGTFMEEIIKAIFRVKPHEDYPDQDQYDIAASKSHNCTEKYPTCDGSIWTSMLGY